MINEKDLLEYENIGRKIKKSDRYNYVDASRIEEHGCTILTVRNYHRSRLF